METFVSCYLHDNVGEAEQLGPHETLDKQPTVRLNHVTSRSKDSQSPKIFYNLVDLYLS